ncbi:hypothetical protein BJV77DRAFT_966643 [Russula vinacea]|nr:hypothetical protein BJV77DRAFT_966643 [Russula vinacea]
MKEALKEAKSKAEMREIATEMVDKNTMLMHTQPLTWPVEPAVSANMSAPSVEDSMPQSIGSQVPTSSIPIAANPDNIAITEPDTIPIIKPNAIPTTEPNTIPTTKPNTIPIIKPNATCNTIPITEHDANPVTELKLTCTGRRSKCKDMSRLSLCLCGESAQLGITSSIQCQRARCETVWAESTQYHLKCVGYYEDV